MDLPDLKPHRVPHLSEQVYFWNLYVTGRGDLAVRPGTSSHGWGTSVDVPQPAMRSAIDKYGASYGWSKRWSDAPSEWWHIRYDPARDQHKGEPLEPKKPDYAFLTDDEQKARRRLLRIRRRARNTADRQEPVLIPQAREATAEIRKHRRKILDNARADGAGGWKKPRSTRALRRPRSTVPAHAPRQGHAGAQQPRPDPARSSPLGGADRSAHVAHTAVTRPRPDTARDRSADRDRLSASAGRSSIQRVKRSASMNVTDYVSVFLAVLAIFSAASGRLEPVARSGTKAPRRTCIGPHLRRLQLGRGSTVT